MVSSELKIARVKVGMNQTQVAQALGVSKPTYLTYEKDPTKLKISQVKELNKILNCDLSQIFFNN